MQRLSMVRWPLTVVTLTYTVAGLSLMAWARSIALPTRGGISPSEVLEGIVPGGLNTMLMVWLVLALLTAVIWVAFWIGSGRSGTSAQSVR